MVYALLFLFIAQYVNMTASAVFTNHIAKNGVSLPMIDKTPKDDILMITPTISNKLSIFIYKIYDKLNLKSILNEL